MQFVELLNKNRNFTLAVECIATHQHQYSNRMMVATLWAGLEAIFGIKSELTFRLAMCVAVVLEPPGVNRLELFRAVKKMYGFRSKAVHGEVLKDGEITKHVLDVRAILSRVLCKIIENKQMYSEKIMEELIFGNGTL